MDFDNMINATKVLPDKRVWKLVINAPLDGYLNMAIDELLFEEARSGRRPPTLRFYQWDGNWVSIGYFQKLERALNVEQAKKLEVQWVRRQTGGKAVVHSEDLTYSLVAGDAQRWGLGLSLKESYRQVASTLASGFRRAGLPVDVPKPAERVPATPEKLDERAGPIPCFAVASDYEITAAGRKLVGSAQYRLGKSFLQHGSIPLTRYNRHLAEEVLTSGKGGSGNQADFRPLYATVEEIAGVSARELISAFQSAFQEAFDIRLEKEELSKTELKEAESLAKDKYSSGRWNEKKKETVLSDER